MSLLYFAFSILLFLFPSLLSYVQPYLYNLGVQHLGEVTSMSLLKRGGMFLLSAFGLMGFEQCSEAFREQAELVRAERIIAGIEEKCGIKFPGEERAKMIAERTAEMKRDRARLADFTFGYKGPDENNTGNSDNNSNTSNKGMAK